MRRRSVAVAAVLAILAGIGAWRALGPSPGAGGDVARDADPAAVSPGCPAPLPAAAPPATATSAGGAPVAGLSPRVGAPRAAPEASSDAESGSASLGIVFPGVVVDESDRPIAGATVRVVSGRTASAGVDPSTVAPVTSAIDGRFRFAGIPDAVEIRVHASAAGRAPTRADQAMVPGIETRCVLLPAAPVRVTVVDAESGAPVGEARVLVFCGGSFKDHFRGVPAIDESVTDGHGRALLRTPGGEVCLLVLPQAHAPVTSDGVRVGPAGVDVTLAVEDGWRVAGRVVDPSGRAIAGARVEASSRLAEYGVRTTDRDGRFSFEHLRGGTEWQTTLEAWAEDLWRAASADPSSAEEVEIRMRPVGQAVWATDSALPSAVWPRPPDTVPVPIREARVRVLDGEERPVEGAMLEACAVRTRLDLFDRATTDADGRVRLRNVSETFLLVVHPPSGATFDTPVTIEKAETVVRLPKGTVVGRVTRIDGSPAQVRLALRHGVRFPDGGEIALGRDGVATDVDGRFRFLAVGDGAYSLAPATEGWIVVGGPCTVRAGDDDVRLVVATWAEETTLRIEVEATDAETGRPADADRIRASATPAGEQGPSSPADVVLVLVRAAPPGNSFRARGPLPPGTYDLALRATGYRDVSLRGIRVPAGDAPPRLRATFEPAARMTGTVLDEQGRPVPGRVEVFLGSRSGVVRPDGTFSLAVVGGNPSAARVDGDYVAGSARRPREPDEPRQDEPRYDFVVRTGGAIRVRLADGREPASAVVVEARPLDPQTGEAGAETSATIDRAWLDANGPSRVLGGLVPGRWRIAVSWDGAALPLREVEVRDREATVLDVVSP